MAINNPITLWSLYDVQTDTYQHNHIENDHCQSNFPTPKNDSDGKPFTSQKAWNKGKWSKIFAYLDENDKVVDKQN